MPRRGLSGNGGEACNASAVPAAAPAAGAFTNPSSSRYGGRMSSWIRVIGYADAGEYLRQLYDRVKGPQGQIDNVMKVHSLRPHTMEGHLALYKSVMHHRGNALPVWFLECMAVYTGLINKCDYSVAHHFAGLVRQLGGDRAE